MRKLKCKLSERTKKLKLPVFREIAPLTAQYQAVNLAGGVPDFSAPSALKDAAVAAIQTDKNQYAPMQGIQALRNRIAKRLNKKYGRSWNEDTEITVCCGVTEGVAAVLMALLDPGDEVIIFEPAFTIYEPDIRLLGGKPVYVDLKPPTFRIERESLEAVITKKTKAIILNSPHNPTGRVFTSQELDVVADIAESYGLFVITDEIYDELVYEPGEQKKLWLYPQINEQVIMVNGFSKSYSVTGWRLGYIAAPDYLTKVIRVAHNYLTISAATPLQEALITGLDFSEEYYTNLRKDFKQKRDFLMCGLESVGIHCIKPQGGYFILADCSCFHGCDDLYLAKWLIKEIGVATVPLSGFYHKKISGQWLRFAFCKKNETLSMGIEKLKRAVQFMS